MAYFEDGRNDKHKRNANLVQAARNNPYLLKIKSPRDRRVLLALSKIDRKNFLPPLSRHLAYEDIALGIGYAATCSQPSLAAFMADLLVLRQGQKVLEVGTGCGYHAAITYELIKDNKKNEKSKENKENRGELTTVEIVPELAEFGQANLEKQFGSMFGSEANIEYLVGDGSKGISGDSFDRIYFTAAVNANTFNQDILLAQLKEPGILMFPESTTKSLALFYKNKGQAAVRSVPGIVFMELQGENR